jgi:hypothetical protein
VVLSEGDLGWAVFGAGERPVSGRRSPSGGCRSVDRSSSAMVFGPTQRQTEQQSDEAPAFTIDASVYAHADARIDARACSVAVTVATREGRDVLRYVMVHKSKV